jgi:hypothetical protein
LKLIKKEITMSINTVALKPSHEYLLGKNIPFDLDNGEVVRFASPSARQSLTIVSSARKINCNDGYLYLTNKRLVYVTASQGDISDFLFAMTSIPQLQFTHELKSPWFGPNYWQFKFLASSMCDGFPPNQYISGSIKFNDGGLFDMVRIFDVLVNDAVNNSHIDEELPRYEL